MLLPGLLLLASSHHEHSLCLRMLLAFCACRCSYINVFAYGAALYMQGSLQVARVGTYLVLLPGMLFCLFLCLPDWQSLAFLLLLQLLG